MGRVGIAIVGVAVLVGDTASGPRWIVPDRCTSDVVWRFIWACFGSVILSYMRIQFSDPILARTLLAQVRITRNQPRLFAIKIIRIRNVCLAPLTGWSVRHPRPRIHPSISSLSSWYRYCCCHRLCRLRQPCSTASCNNTAHLVTVVRVIPRK